MIKLLRRRTPWLIALLSALLLVGLVAPPATAVPRGRTVVLDQTQVAAHQVDLTIRSAALDDTVKVRLLTPDGWEHRSAGQRWPVLYLLHGWLGDHTDWTTLTDVADLPSLRHVLVVMPDGGQTGWYSDWWNGGQGGAPAWETFHLRELRTLLEHSYGAGGRRAIAGLSMGGLGALLYAGRHPGMFQAAASFSGVVDPLAPTGPSWIDQFMSAFGYDPEVLWGDPVAQRAVWQQHDPAYLGRSLAKIEVYMSCGNGQPGPLDPAGTEVNALESDLIGQNETTAAAIRAHHGRLTTDFYGAGTHSWPYWQRSLHRSLPMLLAAIQ